MREARELKKTGRIIYKGCTLIPQIDTTDIDAIFSMAVREMAALPPNDSQQGAIDEAKLWVDQISLEPKPATVPELNAKKIGHKFRLTEDIGWGQCRVTDTKKKAT